MPSVSQVRHRTPFRWRRALFALVLLAVAAIFCRNSLRERIGATGGKDAGERQYVVKRGDFNIAILADGTLDALKRHDLQCEATGRFELKILKVVPDKTVLKKGDTVMEFSPEPCRQLLDKERLDLEAVERDLALAREDLQMQRAANVSAIKTAADALHEAEEAFRKYDELEEAQKRRALQAAILQSETQRAEAEKALSAARQTRAAAQSGNAETLKALDAQVDQAVGALEKSRQTTEDAARNYQVFRQYESPRQRGALTEGVAKARLALQKAIVEAKGKIIQGEREIRSFEERIVQSQKNLKQLEEDRDKLKIVAPVDGIVTLGDLEQRRWNNNTPQEIKPGVVLEAGETVASIPDLSKFVVHAEIPEEYRSQLKLELTAKLRSPALADLVMDGKVDYISPVADNAIRWDSDSPKIYNINITTDTTDSRLMPGMTVKVEISVETVRNVLFIPINLVYARAGANYVRVAGRLGGEEERRVTPGRVSMDFVEITDGLSEGETVLRRNGADNANCAP